MNLPSNECSLFQRVNNSKMAGSPFLCQEGFQIDKFCCNQDCRFEAMACNDNKCSTCFAQHENCSFKRMAHLVVKWQNRMKRQKDLARRLFQIEKEAMGKLIKAQNLFMNSIQEGIFEPHSNILREIYLMNGNSGTCGQQMEAIFESLSKHQEIDTGKVVRCYQEQIGSMLFEVQKDRVAVFQDCFRNQEVCKLQYSEPMPSKRTKVVSDDSPSSQALLVDIIDISPQNTVENAPQQCSQEQLSSTCNHSPNQKNELSYEQPQEQPAQRKYYPTITQEVDSVILNDDPSGQSKKDFLFAQLRNPKQLQLLFRASKHRFQASKFHSVCDGIDDTVTIVHTEPGRRVAGWTRLKWSTPNFFQQQAKEGDAFLLQLDIKQKYIPKKYCKKKSLYDHQRFGPSFGSDLIISNNCDFNYESRSTFPSFYNRPGNPYKANKKNKAILCGCEENNFRIKQYEVFKVIRE